MYTDFIKAFEDHIKKTKKDLKKDFQNPLCINSLTFRKTILIEFLKFMFLILSALIIFYQGFKIKLLSLPLLKEVIGLKVDINSMKITFQEELNMSTYKFIVDFI